MNAHTVVSYLPQINDQIKTVYLSFIELSEVRSMLHARSSAFVSGNAEDYKRARYDLRRSIKEAKRQYRLKLKGYYSTADSRRMRQGLPLITDYQQRSRGATTSQATLPDELNEFCACFETLITD